MRKLGILIVLFLVSMSLSATPVLAFNPQLEPPARERIVELLQELREVVADADTGLFRGSVYTYAEQQKSALIKKINEVIMMFEMDRGYAGGYHKLNEDIKPKLWNPVYDDLHKRSWLNPLYKDVFTFAERCQGLIEEINRLLPDGSIS